MSKLRELIKESTKKTRLIGGAIILVVVVLAGLTPSSKDEDLPIETAVAGVRDLSISFSVDGATEVEKAELKFQSSGEVAQIYVSEGDIVRKGAYIAQLNVQDLSIRLQSAQDDYRAKQASAEYAEEQVQGHDTDETLEQKDLRTRAQAARDIAYNAVLEAQRSFRESTLISPIDGLVSLIDMKVGEATNSQSAPVSAVITKPDSLIFIAYLEETDILEINSEQKITIEIDSLEDVVFDAELLFVSNIATTDDNGFPTYKVKAKVTNQEDVLLLDGMTGEIIFTTKEVPDVLAIPNASVYREEGKGYVDVIEDEKVEKREIQTGFTDGKYVEVVSGLTKGEIVLVQ